MVEKYRVFQSLIKPQRKIVVTKNRKVDFSLWFGCLNGFDTTMSKNFL